MLSTTFFADFCEEEPHIFFIYHIRSRCAVAWFFAEKYCLSAFQYYDSSEYNWIGVRFTLLFRYFAENEPDSHRLFEVNSVNIDSDFLGGSYDIE